MQPVPPRSLSAAIAHCRAGGALLVPTYTRATIIKAKHIDQWAAAGKPLLREEGDGYRMQTGKTSVYLLPGQLRFA